MAPSKNTRMQRVSRHDQGAALAVAFASREVGTASDTRRGKRRPNALIKSSLTKTTVPWTEQSSNVL